MFLRTFSFELSPGEKSSTSFKCFSFRRSMPSLFSDEGFPDSLPTLSHHFGGENCLSSDS